MLIELSPQTCAGQAFAPHTLAMISVFQPVAALHGFCPGATATTMSPFFTF